MCSVIFVIYLLYIKYVVNIYKVLQLFVYVYYKFNIKQFLSCIFFCPISTGSTAYICKTFHVCSFIS